MTGTDAEVEASDPLARFLDRKYRQVWAVHRVTGERVFLDRGQATDEMRIYTRAELMCPVPGCEVKISARGRSKRDHFFHLNPSGHAEGEGEWHLQAKALLAEWAQRLDGYTAQEEETVPVPGTDRVRRADVMATRANGQKVALEVEYKDYKPEKWRAKQTDYDSGGLACTWVFGHLPRYLRQPRKPHGWPEDQTWDQLKWVELTEAVARAGRPVVFINPVERAVVTAIQRQRTLEDARRDPQWWRHPELVGNRLAHPECREDPVLILDPLDECILHPTGGLLTPTMRAIQSERGRITALATEARLQAEAEAARRAALSEKYRVQQAARQVDEEARAERARAYALQKRAEAAAAWEASPLRARIVASHKEVPEFLETELSRDYGVLAHPAHWHCQLFTDLVLGPPGSPMLGKTVTMKQVYGMLKAAGFKMHSQPHRRSHAVRDFLLHLRELGYVTFHMDSRGSIYDITVTADFTSPPTTQSAPQQQAPLGSLHRPRPMPPVSARPKVQEPSPTTQEIAWQKSMVRKTIVREHNGGIPVWISHDERPDLADAIDALPEHWHAYLYLKYIHTRPKGYTFTLRDACQTLVQHHLVPAVTDQVRQAVAAYLRWLDSQRLLVAPKGDTTDLRYFVA